jgi:hypothetical protein
MTMANQLVDLTKPITSEVNRLILNIAEIYKDVDSSFSEEELDKAQALVFSYRDAAVTSLHSMFSQTLTQAIVTTPSEEPVKPVVISKPKVPPRLEGPVISPPREVSEEGSSPSIKQILEGADAVSKTPSISSIASAFIDEEDLRTPIPATKRAPVKHPPVEIKPPDYIERVHKIQDMVILFADDPSPVIKKVMCSILTEVSSILNWETLEEKNRYSSNTELWGKLNTLVTNIRRMSNSLASASDSKIIEVKNRLEGLLLDLLETNEKKVAPPEEREYQWLKKKCFWWL